MEVIHRAPGARLAPFVASLGFYADADAAGWETRVSDAGSQLVINLAGDVTSCFDGPGFAHRHQAGGAALCGPHPRPVLLDVTQQRSMICVAFRPGGAYPFFRYPADELTGPVIDLGDLWGRDGATLAERLRAAPGPHAALAEVEAVLLARAVRPLRADPLIAAAAAALRGDRPVAAVSDGLGLSPRLLRRRFAARVGVSPKRFARTQRMQHLLAAVSAGSAGSVSAGSAGGAVAAPVDWARAAAEFGFYDQAHLIHEFRAFTGGTPAAYRARSATEPNHVRRPA